jgi:site-specific recombinase XerD
LIGFIGKGGKQRSVALPAQALKIITEYLASDDPEAGRQR